MLPAMARILDVFLNRNTGKVCSAYPDHERLLAGLQREEPAAIRCLSAKIGGSVYKIGKGFHLSDEDIEELQCDCIILFIRKIRTGAYVYQGYDPASYVVEIAKRHVRYVARKVQRHATQDLDTVPETAEEEADFAGCLERIEWLNALLGKIDDNCRRLLQLKYLEERRDKEVIEQKLTQYSTVDALKNHRSRCMKKLVDLAQTLKPGFAE